MVKTRVYVETTIPSFYFEERTAPDIVARKVDAGLVGLGRRTS